MKPTYDVVVIGAGINGLCTAAYLAKTGLSVAVFEARNEIAANCSTQEVMRPGVRCNLHASAIGAWTSPAYEELEMERFGFEPALTEWREVYPFDDGTCAVTHHYDAEKTYFALQQLNAKDAEQFRKLFNYFAGYRAELCQEFLFTKPNPASFQRTLDIIDKSGLLPSDWLQMTGVQLFGDMFEDERFQVFLLHFGIEYGFDPWFKGISGLGVMLAFCMAPWVVAKGGSHTLPHALSRCLLKYGGEIFQSCFVEKIIVEQGVAKGIVLAKESPYPERAIMASKAVISNLSPTPTFLWLVGEENLPPEIVPALKMYDHEAVVLHTTVWLLNERMDFKCFDWTDKYIDPAIRTTSGSFEFGPQTVDELLKLQTYYVKGELPDPPICVGGCFRFTVSDPSLTPPGLHMVQVWANTPYDIRRWGNRKLSGAGAWDEVREEYSDLVEDSLARYAPNLKTAKVDRYADSPLDQVRRNASMLKAGEGGGLLAPHQFYMNRPFPGCDAPRTPIQQLYTTEVGIPRSTMMTQAYITACQVAEDLGVRDQPWWNVKPVEPFARVLKRLGIPLKRSF